MHVRQTHSLDGTTLAFDLYAAVAPCAVLLVPGFWRTRQHPVIREVARQIAERLGPCAVMDCRGHGESGGVFEFDRHEHHDVAAVTLALLEETGAERVVLLGFSAGGAIAISSAARHRGLPIAGLILVSPVCDFRRVVPRPNPFTNHRHLSLRAAMKAPRFRWPGSDRLSPIDDTRKVTAPICLIHARNDWLVSHRHSEAIYRGAHDAELHVLDIPGRYHADTLFSVAPELVWPLVERFVRRVSST